MINASGRSWTTVHIGVLLKVKLRNVISNGHQSVSKLKRGFDFKQKPLNPKSKILLNHFEYHNLITNKYNLTTNMSDYCQVRSLEKQHRVI